MVRVRSSLVAFCLVLGLSSAAHASIITIDPATFPLGTDLSHLFDGVTLAIAAQPPRQASFDPQFSPALVGGSWGGAGASTHSVGGVLWQGEGFASCSQSTSVGACVEDYRLLELRFDRPTDYVSFTTSFITDGGEMFLYDVNGQLLLHPSTESDRQRGPDGGTVAINAIQRPQADIARVVFGGYHTSTSVTRLEYHKVPAPTTLAIVAIGALGLSTRRRR